MIYSSFASIYDGFMAPLEYLFLGRWRAEAASYLPAGGMILELGAGTGLNFAHYAECRHVVASELSLEMITRAKTRAESIDLVSADAQTLPFLDNHFDAGFATLVFCSIPDPEKAFNEIQRVVKPHGKIVLLEHVRPKGLSGYVFDVLNIVTVALIDDHFNRETAAIAERSGLIAVDVQSKAGGAVNLIVCENPA